MAHLMATFALFVGISLANGFMEPQPTQHLFKLDATSFPFAHPTKDMASSLEETKIADKTTNTWVYPLNALLALQEHVRLDADNNKAFWREVVWERKYHSKAWKKRISGMFTRQAQHKARLQGAYEILSNPATHLQPAIALPTAAELAQRVADVPVIDDSVKYGKDVADFVPDAVLTFRQFLQTAQDTVKDLSLNPYNPPPSSNLSKGQLIDKEDVETYFIEDWDEDIQYKPKFPPITTAIAIPKRGGRWTPEPPKPYSWLDKIVNQPEVLHGENWPQNVKDWKSGTEYRTYGRRSPSHLYDDSSLYTTLEGSIYDLDKELYVEPKFPKLPGVHYNWSRRFVDEYWSPEDDWIFTDEQHEEHIKNYAKKVL